MWPGDKVVRLTARWLRRKSWPLIGVLLLAVAFWLPPFPAQADLTVIASDDFESDSYFGGTGWAANWNASTAVAIVTTEQPHSGQRHLEMRGSAIASRTVDLTGWTSVELAFRARARSLESGDTVTAEVSSDGRDWQVLETWGDGDDENEYHLYEYYLSGMTGSDTFFVRFISQMNEPSDYFYLDDILIQGEPVPADTIAPPITSPLSAPDAVSVPIAPVVSSLAGTSSGVIVLDSAFSDWAGYSNLLDPAGDASKSRGDIAAFYWGNNGGAEVNYWMIQRYPAIPSSEDDDDDEGEDDEDDDGNGPGNSLVKKVKYTIYIDTDNNGDFTGPDDRRVLVDYHPRASHSEVRVKVKPASGGQTLYSAEGDWGESVAEGGRRVELAAFWTDLGISNGDVIRMYLESDRGDRAPDGGDIQWSPASILGFWLLSTAMALGGVALWRIHKRRETVCPSGRE